MKLKLLRYWGLVPIFLILAHLLADHLTAQAEKGEADFVMTKKAVEVLEYDLRGVKTSSWTMPVAVRRHRATGACWVGDYQKDGNLIFSPAPSGVCK